MRKFYSVFFGCTLLVACGPKQLAEYTSSNYSLDSSYSNTKLDTMLIPYRVGMEEQMSIVIGVAEQDLKSFAPESPLSNFVADLVYAKGYEYAALNAIGAQHHTIFSLLNFGGLRSTINKGEVTVRTIYELMPFDNSIVIVKLTPQKIKDLLNYLMEVKGQPIGNAIAYVTFDNLYLKVGSEKYNFDKDLYVVTSDYLANGGDKMNFFKEPIEKWETNILIRDAITEHIKRIKNITYTPDEGRMVIVKK